VEPLEVIRESDSAGPSNQLQIEESNA